MGQTMVKTSIWPSWSFSQTISRSPGATPGIPLVMYMWNTHHTRSSPLMKHPRQQKKPPVCDWSNSIATSATSFQTKRKEEHIKIIFLTLLTHIIRRSMCRNLLTYFKSYFLCFTDLLLGKATVPPNIICLYCCALDFISQLCASKHNRILFFKACIL